MKRTERIAAITEILMSRPNELIPLGFFALKFSAAKSTISEDLVTIKDSMLLSGKGILDTLPGASGGVKYLPEIQEPEAREFLKRLASKLSSADRMLPGGFLYITDVLFDPTIVRPLGLIFASLFRDRKIDAVVTVETKGIPLALMAADALGVPTVVIRHGNKVTEGSSVSINYVSGSSKRIQAMTLSKKALQPGRRVLVIDDYLKAGGTAKGIISLMREFEAEVVGLGILMEESISSSVRMIDNYCALLSLVEINQAEEKMVVKANDLWKK